MTGKLNEPRPLAAGLLPRVKRPALLAGIAILVVAATATGAWLTKPPASELPKVATADKAKPAAVETPRSAATPAASIAAAQPSTPPEPTDKADPPTASPSASEPSKPADWAAMPIDELRAKANANEIPAMEDLARRLIQGAGVTKDQQAGAGWLLRAAQLGSAQSAFNVAVMYERGFVVERDSTRAIEWYRKAVDANLPVAKHNLALLLRDGKGAARDGKEAVELLRSAARQGMAASMFTLGDIHERGDAAPKDSAMALAWFAIAAEFERQTNRGAESALAKTAAQRAETLQRIMTPPELERAQKIGQSEFKLIVEALSPPEPPSKDPAAAETATAPPPPSSPPSPGDTDPPDWPKAVNDQIRAIQKLLVDLKYLRDKPDGVIGPVTRAAIRAFQRSIGARETGEPTKEVYAALKEALAERDVVANSPLPPPSKAEAAKAEAEKAEAAKTEAAKAEAAKAEAAKAEAAKAEAAKAEAAKAEAVKIETDKIEAAKAEAAKIEAAKAEAAKAESAKAEAAKTEVAKADPPKPALPKIETAKPAAALTAALPESSEASAKPEPPAAVVDLGQPEPAPAPPTSADFMQAAPRLEPGTPPAVAWPARSADRVRTIQRLLLELNFSRDVPDGVNGPNTRAAIRDYERAAGLDVTGEPSRALFDSLTELRGIMVPKPN